ncbi:transposase, partial [Carnobacterium divergens]
MAKYSLEFKLKIVQEHLEEKRGINCLAKKYGFNCNTQIRKWIHAYNELGEEGLLRSRKCRNYSV